MTKELFQKYIDGRCNPQEKWKTEEWLHTCTPDELDDLLIQVWNDKENPVMPAGQANEMWKIIAVSARQQKPAAKLISMFPPKKWAVAIAALAVLTIGIVWTSQKKQAPAVLTQQVQTTPVDTIVDWVHVVNTNEKEKLVVLDDGSEILLFTTSAITYRARFGTERRDIFLDGKGIFQVAKDSQRPFTVYSGDIATTALGTKFLVDASSKRSSIHVRLYEGKIIVKTGRYALNSWKKQELLLPGDVLDYDINNKSAIVKHRNKLAKEKYNKAHSPGELTFNNEQLYIVFEKMEQKYSVEIKYNKADIKGMYFTGSISKNSSLTGSLRIITQMNGLILKEEDGKYSIQKAE